MENTIKIGQKIKSLRKAHDMTQEKLADYLGVSFQAISKWECGFASPDISFLVPLSHLFGVSIDDLFDNSPQSTNCRREKFKKAYEETWQTGDTKIRYEIAKTAVEEYPGDFEFLVNLAYTEWSYGMHEMKNSPEEHKKLCESSIRHAELVIENAEDEAFKAHALRTITFSLHDLGRQKEALKYARMSNDAELITICMTGDEKIKSEQEKIERIFSDLIGRLSKPNNRIEELDAADALIKLMIPDGNYLFYAGELMHNEIWRAGYYSRHHMFEKAITSLKQAHKYATEYDTFCHNNCIETYTCPVFDHVGFDPQKLMYSGASTLCEDFIEYLDWEWFDSIRNTDEFKVLYHL